MYVCDSADSGNGNKCELVSSNGTRERERVKKSSARFKKCLNKQGGKWSRLEGAAGVEEVQEVAAGIGQREGGRGLN